jgi:hypothetical protein
MRKSRYTDQEIAEAFPHEARPGFCSVTESGSMVPASRTGFAAWESRRFSLQPRSPWQNPFVERLIGSIRRECLDHVLVLNEAHLRRVLRQYSPGASESSASVARHGSESAAMVPPGRGHSANPPRRVILTELRGGGRRCGPSGSR